MPMPADFAWRRTVSSTQLSTALDGCPMTCAPTMRLALHFDMASEMKAPPMPKTAAKASRPPRLSPPSASIGSSPSSWTTMLSTIRIAKLVARKRTTRFMAGFSVWR